MSPDERAARAFARLAESLSDEIVNASDAELADVFPGRSGRVAADAWRQMVRRTAASAGSGDAPLDPSLHHPEIDRDREEDAP